jgi:ketosteroid isomerase-like protein
MKIIVVAVIAICLHTLMCPPADANEEEATIVRNLLDLTEAMNNIRASSNAQSVLKFYAQEYWGIENGKAMRLKDLQKDLDEETQRMYFVEPPPKKYAVKKIKVEASNQLAWLAFDYSFIEGVPNSIVRQEEGKCTMVVRKISNKWLIVHDHCSTPRQKN